MKTSQSLGSTLIQLVPALTLSEGAGVTVHRTIGTPALRNLDPFLMLDQFGSKDPDDYIAGFPDHPHRGFITLTYMLDGHMEHSDSLGNKGDLRAGGIQWMKAARGVIHSEMPHQTHGHMRGFQLWINLPARDKMSEPAYQDYAAEEIPEVETATARVRLLAGEYGGERGSIEDPRTHLRYLDVAIKPGATFVQELPLDFQSFVSVFEGDASLEGQNLPRHSLAVLGPGTGVTIRAGTAGTRLILVSARPLREPVVQSGPFVMNTREEIQQAYEDYRLGRLA